MYLPYEVAKRRVDEFASQEEHDSSECSECAAFLALGIKALEAIRTAEEILLEAGRLGIGPIDRRLVESIDLLYESWLKPSARASAWIAHLAAKGLAPHNVEKFSATKQLAETIVARNAIIRASDEPMFDDSESMDSPPMPPIATVQLPMQGLADRQ